jgi:hypothetical protein
MDDLDALKRRLDDWKALLRVVGREAAAIALECDRLFEEFADHPQAAELRRNIDEVMRAAGKFNA